MDAPHQTMNVTSKTDLKTLEKELKDAFKSGNEAETEAIAKKIKFLNTDNALVKKVMQKLEKKREKDQAKAKADKIKEYEHMLKKLYKAGDLAKLRALTAEYKIFNPQSQSPEKWLKKADKKEKKAKSGGLFGFLFKKSKATTEMATEAKPVMPPVHQPNPEDPHAILTSAQKGPSSALPDLKLTAGPAKPSAPVAPKPMPAVPAVAQSTPTPAVAPAKPMVAPMPTMPVSAPKPMSAVSTPVPAPKVPTPSPAPVAKAPEMKPAMPAAMEVKKETTPMSAPAPVSPVKAPEMKPAAPMPEVKKASPQPTMANASTKPEAKGNTFTKIFGKKEVTDKQSIMDRIVAKVDQKKVVAPVMPQPKKEAKPFNLLGFSKILMNFTVLFIVLTGAYLYVDFLDKDNAVLGLVGFESNTGSRLHQAAEDLSQKKREETVLNKDISLYKAGYGDTSLKTIETVMDERINWPDIFAKINEVTNSVYELNDFFKYIEYNNYSFDAEKGTIRVSGVLTDPQGRNLTKLVELEEAFKYYPKDKNNAEDPTKPYFQGFKEMTTFAKSLNQLTGRYVSNFQLSFSLNQ